MAERRFNSERGKLTPRQKQRVRQGRAWAEANKGELSRAAVVRKAELLALRDAVRALKREREARGLSLAEVAQRSGIDKSNLSKLENNPYPNPTLNTLARIADAIGVKLAIGIVPAA